MPRIKCPHCGWKDDVDQSYVGQEVECPDCEKDFTAKQLKRRKKTISGTARSRSSRQAAREKPTREKEAEIEVEDLTFSKRAVKLFFSWVGIFAWGPTVMTILLLLANDDNQRGASSRRASAQALQAMAGGMTAGSIIVLGVFFTLIGSIIFAIIVKVTHKKKRSR